LREISYPVFKIGTTKPLFEEGVHFYIKYEEDKPPGYAIVDDKTVQGDTLAKRRLKLLKQGTPLKKLSKAIFYLGDLVKIAKANIWFIDSTGKVFNYKKETFHKVIVKKITKIIPINTGGAIIEVDGIMSRFKVLFAPSAYSKYASLLLDGMSYILYGLHEEPPEIKNRKI
jgi:hypothetical protein